MPELLLELFCEEIPARMQTGAAADLKRLVTDALVERGLLYEGAVAHVTPRRLALHVAGLPARQPDRHEERKGPRVGAPAAAVEGFLKSAGLASLDAATIVDDPKKGQFYVARIDRPGAATLDVLADILPAIIRSFPWPKSMRWGAASVRPDALRWVRPLHAIVATFGPETEEPEIVPFAVDGIAASNITFGHRFMAPGAIKVRRFDDYVPALAAAKVVVDAARRRDIILHDAKDLAFAQRLDLVEDDALLAEVAGLVEWPRVLLGRFDPAFLAIPPEVIRATIRVNQKCFVLREGETLSQRERVVAERPGEGLESGSASNPLTPLLRSDPLPMGEGGLAPAFLLVSNIEARDGGAAVVAGNERVVAARLSDAKFFWESDLRIPLQDRLPKLEKIVFHEKLGTQGERVKRIAALARELAPLVGADADKAARAAELCKADLVSEMVGEFPELQGLMGRYYAQAQGEDASVAMAIEDHYRPQGPSDRVPTDPVAIAVALADKIDTLVGFWAIDEKPTGSKDPYALRRAALGVIRIVVENGVRLRLAPFAKQQAADLLAFFADRLKVYLRDKGARHDLIDAAMGANPLPRAGEGAPAKPGAGEGSQGENSIRERTGSPHPSGSAGHLLPRAGEGSAPNDDLLLIVRRVEALGALLDSDDGKNLLAGYKRAANILRAEEKKDGARAFDAAPNPSTFQIDEERALAAALAHANDSVAAALSREDFPAAMSALASLRAPVDAFFDKVTVNADDPALRANRLRLLARLRDAMHAVADFSKVAG